MTISPDPTRAPAPASTATLANPDQAAAWNGPEGANWAEAGDAEPADADLVGPMLEAAAIRPGEAVLDIGCGTGGATRRAARLAGPEGRAVGIDLSTHMVDVATEAAAREGLANATFIAADAQVHAFPEASFDAAISHFGALFFGDPATAFANIARALRPGGWLALVAPQAMDSCDWYRVPLATLTGRLPTPEERPSKMFSLADPDLTTALLEDAGFDDVWLARTPWRLWFGPDAATAASFFARSGPGRAVIEQDPTLDEARAERLLAIALADHESDDGVRLAGQHWIVTARRSR